MEIVTLFCEIHDFSTQLEPWLNTYLLHRPPYNPAIQALLQPTPDFEYLAAVAAADGLDIIGAVGNTTGVDARSYRHGDRPPTCSSRNHPAGAQRHQLYSIARASPRSGDSRRRAGRGRLAGSQCNHLVGGSTLQ
jgi:hypothetical protein